MQSGFTANIFRSVVALGCALAFIAPAAALEVKSCEEAHVGLEDLIAPAAKHSRTFKDDSISIYSVDTVEPVCCAAGVAIVMPDVSDEAGGSKCVAIVGVASIQLDEATTEEDPAKGLLITIPTRVFSDAADSAPGDPMRIRIDAGKGSATLE